jgi:ATPase subunit of ABC transporter with duplicated ATPase domains
MKMKKMSKEKRNRKRKTRMIRKRRRKEDGRTEMKGKTVTSGIVSKATLIEEERIKLRHNGRLAWGGRNRGCGKRLIVFADALIPGSSGQPIVTKSLISEQ